MKLSDDMVQALADLSMHPDSVRGPSNTGLGAGTYKALQKRGLVWPKAWRTWKLSAAGRDALQKHSKAS